MSRYAAGTQVPAEKSRIEIERTLERYGAASFFYASEPGSVIVGFKAHDRIIKMRLPLPKREDFRLQPRSTWRERTKEAQESAFEQAVRERWRRLALAIKAKLEVVESGISSFESEFLAHIVTYDGRTVGEAVAPQIAQSYKTGRNVPLMLMAPEDRP